MVRQTQLEWQWDYRTLPTLKLLVLEFPDTDAVEQSETEHQQLRVQRAVRLTGAGPAQVLQQAQQTSTHQGTLYAPPEQALGQGQPYLMQLVLHLGAFKQ